MRYYVFTESGHWEESDAAMEAANSSNTEEGTAAEGERVVSGHPSSSSDALAAASGSARNASSGTLAADAGAVRIASQQAAGANASVLARFSDGVRGWFLDTFPAPTPLQERAWEVVARKENALVIAPTGSGKTLAAFLFAIDALMRERAAFPEVGAGGGTGAEGGAEFEEAARDAAADAVAKPEKAAGGKRAKSASLPVKGVRVLYVSPLKALGADVERNLQEPLAGIAQRIAQAGAAMPSVRTGMRTGDTTPEERRALVRNPPDILITTPESLYLMLTSKARETLRTVDTVIVDEVHAMAGDKRGAHLALSLERLDSLLENPAQRIGLSATVRPPEEIARFLGGVRPVSIVASQDRPDMDVRVSVPVQDMTAVPSFSGFEPDKLVSSAAESRRTGGGPRRAPAEQAWKSDRALRAVMDGRAPKAATPDSRVGSSSIWPYVEAAILDEVLAHRTTIVFVNSRGLCEKLTSRLNELYAKRKGAFPEGGEAVASGIRSGMGATTDLAQATAEVIAKAHHGSVSKERRQQVERELKAGELPCVVATSSLELGIDMGSIDLVLQVAPPPSVASGLQRIGRANHQVGGRSEGIVYPRTRTEVIDAAVVSEGMSAGAIEKTTVVKNPLDVLAQQTVAAVSMEDVSPDEWYATVCRCAPFSDLPRRAFDAVLGMLSGAYSSAELADFSPRIIWDRERNLLIARPGSQRQAVTAAGTIPDRGMFSVVLPEADAKAGRRRVGELDEEMVYESRVGDIIALGTSTWRIREITRDRVIVEPAPGRSARLPFWHGEGIGRPAETGRAKGAFVRAVASALDAPDEDEGDDAEGVCGGVEPGMLARLRADGLDENARRNLIELIGAQRAATGFVPDDRTLVVERCEDEQGDWRVMLHSPYGRRVHEPWAMAVTDRIVRTRGFDPQTLAMDDGIILRIPMSETLLPGAELFAFDPSELERVVRDRVDSTSLFAARFRECAARSLLMSSTAPGKRAPLWQQRLRAGQLLEAARREGDFPLLAETARECLQDVYDMESLLALMDDIQAGAVRLVEAQTSTPSPFAAPLLFGYVGDHLYDGDLPNAERKASLLSLDPTLLGELLGSDEVGGLIDPEVVRTVESQLQRLASDRRVRGVEGVADLLRALGPLTVGEVAERLRRDGGCDEDAAGGSSCAFGEAQALLDELARSHRAFVATIGGASRWASFDDARLLRDALGTDAPGWTASSELAEPSGGSPGRYHPLDELLARFARTHGPFATADAAAAFGIGCAVARDGLERLAAEGRIVQGRFKSEDGGTADAEGEVRQWVSADVFKRLRSLSLAKARKAVRPVGSDAYVRFLLDLQGAGSFGRGRFEGVEGVAHVLSQFEGVYLPAALWESVVLPSRVRDYRPSMLDELIASGEVMWVGGHRDESIDADPGHGKARSSTAGADFGSRNRTSSASSAAAGLIAFYPTDSPFAPLQPDVEDGVFESAVSESGDSRLAGDRFGDGAQEADSASMGTAIVEALGFGGGLFFRQIVDAVRRRLASVRVDEDSVASMLQRLMWQGRVTNDTFAPVRTVASAESAPRARSASRRRVSSRRARARADYSEAMGKSSFGNVRAVQSGRWSLVSPSDENDTVRAIALVDSLLDRYGVLTRDIALAAGVSGGLGSLMPVLRSMEDAGDLLRGMFVEGLGPAQFAARETVDALRAYAGNDDPGADRRTAMAVLAADDPASLFGAGIAWPPVGGFSGADAKAVAGGFDVREDSDGSRMLDDAGTDASDAAEKTVSEDSCEGSSGRSLRPSRRSGSLVVIHCGTPVLYAAPSLRSIIAFSDDLAVLADAACALVEHVQKSLKREGGAGARKKMLVEEFNGRSVLDTPFAAILQHEGFVRLPDGMRFYASPF
ncbi:DNA glycosylase AlkZ-like family protein [Raoultibacter massiliensis]|uniref:Crosslink repair DNA glycosylase YcaQ family protein n=1 Tax=Raoultibacter massiliensis TaxID=1852371 RepID=A0ABV1JGH0_9ACTN